jgi:peptidoglycan/xylan/chitin deacetylase (PgdA/CDA1 family)
MPRASFGPLAARVAVVAAVVALVLSVALSGPATRAVDPAPTGAAATQPTATAAPRSGATEHPAATPEPSPSPGVPSVVPSASPAILGDSSGAVAPRQVLVNVPVPVFAHGSRAQRVIALTFDDGYSPSATAQILAILESEHVAATFFPYAAAVQRAPSLWRSVAAAGYPIANHTATHPDLTGLSADHVRAQLEGARTTIERITGVPMVDVFRPPYGAWNAAVLREAAAAGCLGAVLWDVDTRDWTGIPASTVAARAEAGINGSIVLMHAGPAQTPRALPAIIAWYRSHGYVFVTIPELLGAQLAGLQPSGSPGLPSPTPTLQPSPPAPETRLSPTPR